MTKDVKRFFSTLILVFCITVTSIPLPTMTSMQVEAATIKLNKSKVSLYTGNTYTLKISGTDQKTTWASNNNSVATISSKGTITGIKKGSAVVTATVGSKKYKCSVTVNDPIISANKLKLSVSEESKLTIKGATGSVTWKSSDKSVVTVSKDGTVLAKSTGTAKITGKYKNKTYTCNVTVIYKKLVAETNITCSEKTKVMIKVNDAQDDEYVSYDIDDTDIINCEFGDWTDDDKVELYIVPTGFGSTTVKITSNYSDEELIIHVTVKESSDSKKLTAEEVYQKSSSATVQINTDLATGSGFFTSNGVVVTNYHVVEGASSISVSLKDGKEYKVSSILGYSADLDIAILSIPTKNPVLSINKHGVKVGETVYALGSSLGLTDTFSNGIITNASRVIDDVDYIQTNAAISPGNSGGPLLNAYGEVMGINTMQLIDGQNLNFAINIKQLKNVNTDNPITVAEFKDQTYNSDAILEASVLEDETKSSSMIMSQVVKSGSYIWGSAKPVQNDYYNITLTKSSIVAIAATPVTDYETDLDNLKIEIVDAQNNVLSVASVLEYDDSKLLMTYTTLPAGTYYIKVYSTYTSAEIPYLVMLNYE